MMKKLLLLCCALSVSYASFACTTCNKQIKQAIWNSTFVPNLLTMLSAFLVLAIIVLVLTWLSVKRHTAKLSRHPGSRLLSPVPLTTTATILGIGLGGFVDGIAFHQILQWHEMLSN